jgi:hypothetical protein
MDRNPFGLNQLASLRGGSHKRRYLGVEGSALLAFQRFQAAA